jgi:hypothetical protein
MIFHAFALDEFLGIVMSECERVFGFRTLVPYLGYILENALHIRFEAYRTGGADTIKYFSRMPCGIKKAAVAFNPATTAKYCAL